MVFLRFDEFIMVKPGQETQQQKSPNNGRKQQDKQTKSPLKGMVNPPDTIQCISFFLVIINIRSAILLLQLLLLLFDTRIKNLTPCL